MREKHRKTETTFATDAHPHVSGVLRQIADFLDTNYPAEIPWFSVTFLQYDDPLRCWAGELTMQSELVEGAKP